MTIRRAGIALVDGRPDGCAILVRRRRVRGRRQGEVNFPISCGPESQKAFNHAVWTLHSFWYPEALKSLHRHHQGRAGLRDGLLGHRDEQLVPAVVPAERRRC